MSLYQRLILWLSLIKLAIRDLYLKLEWIFRRENMGLIVSLRLDLDLWSNCSSLWTDNGGPSGSRFAPFLPSSEVSPLHWLLGIYGVWSLKDREILELHIYFRMTKLCLWSSYSGGFSFDQFSVLPSFDR